MPWLQHHRGDLSVLVHPSLGDVLAEHVDDAISRGRPLALHGERVRAASMRRCLGEPGWLLRGVSALKQGSVLEESRDEEVEKRSDASSLSEIGVNEQPERRRRFRR